MDYHSQVRIFHKLEKTLFQNAINPYPRTIVNRGFQFIPYSKMVDIINEFETDSRTVLQSKSAF